MTKTYDHWLRDQELIEAKATAPAQRSRWQHLIIAHALGLSVADADAALDSQQRAA